MSIDMHHGDYQQWQQDTDNGGFRVHLDDPPAFLDTAAHCPVCGDRIGTHDSVDVVRASGEIYACVDAEGRARTLPDTFDPYE